jgi:hypothetical protein
MDHRRLLIVVLSLLAGPVLAAQGGPVYVSLPTLPVVGGACTSSRVQIEATTGDSWCCTANQWARCGSPVLNSGSVAVPITSSVASGVNAFACSVNGCRFDLGTGANDHLTSDGTSILTPGGFTAGGLAASRLTLSPTAGLATCAAGTVGRHEIVSVAGSGNRTKECLCTSDNAASPAYAWKNITSVFASEAASIGTTTTCP